MKEHVIIGKDRTVTIPASLRKIGIQHDHNVNTITFDCPRYPDEDSSVDMSKMTVFINYMLPDRNKTLAASAGVNIRIDPDDETIMHFDWKITNAITIENGVLTTLICIKHTDAYGKELFHWNTDLTQAFSVGEGMETSEEILEEKYDLITQLLSSLDDTNTSIEAANARIDELKGDLDNVLDDNIIDVNSKFPFMKGWFVSSVDGSIVKGVNYSHTPFIPIRCGDVISIYTQPGSVGAYYNSNYEFVSGISRNSSKYEDIKVPNGVSYVRLSQMAEPKNVTIKTRVIQTSSAQKVLSIKYNDSNLIINKFIDSNTGNEVEKTGYKATDYIEVSRFEYISISTVRSNSVGAFYDKDKNYISGIVTPNPSDTYTNFIVNIPSGAMYVRFTIENARFIPNIEEYEISFILKKLDSTNVTDYVDTDKTLTLDKPANAKAVMDKINDMLSSNKTFFVDKNISITDDTHFNKFSDAIFEAVKHKNSTVYVYPNNYELLEEHESDYWYNNRVANRYAGIVLKNNVRIIGLGCECNVSMTYDGSDNNYKEYLSPFVVCGSFTIENINITSCECSYCVHDDCAIYPSREMNIIGKIINCNMEHKGRTNFVSGGSADQCIGGGAGENGYRLIDGGIYKATNEQGIVISYHRQSGSSESRTHVDIRNVYSDTGSVGFGAFGSSYLSGVVCNSHFSKDVSIDNNDHISVKCFNIEVN